LNGTLRISIPSSAVITSISQQIDRRDPAKESQVLQFQISQFKPFQLQYLDSSQRRNFEINLLFSGIFFGVAASGLAEIPILFFLKDAGARKNESKEANTHKNEVKEKPETKSLIAEYKTLSDSVNRRSSETLIADSFLFPTSLAVVTFAVANKEALGTSAIAGLPTAGVLPLLSALVVGIFYFLWFTTS